ncbi:hypothetical protein, partial [Brasilonema bromeliae]|uniref:hypothetical protein n=1 Tax=Brasilonema bromeliae TaxID=383615 RepID=UPI001B7D0762
GHSCLTHDPSGMRKAHALRLTPDACCRENATCYPAGSRPPGVYKPGNPSNAVAPLPQHWSH